MKTKKQKIEDFINQIHPIYELLKWRWYDKGIPTKKELKDELLSHINQLETSSIESISGGGLYAERDENIISFGLILHGYSFHCSKGGDRKCIDPQCDCDGDKYYEGIHSGKCARFQDLQCKPKEGTRVTPIGVLGIEDVPATPHTIAKIGDEMPFHELKVLKRKLNEVIDHPNQQER